MIRRKPIGRSSNSAHALPPRRKFYPSDFATMAVGQPLLPGAKPIRRDVQQRRRHSPSLMFLIIKRTRMRLSQPNLRCIVWDRVLRFP